MTQSKYQLDSEENRQFLKKMREDLLKFGIRFPSPTGASYYLGDDGTPWTERPRETWITCRMAHVYSMGSLLGYEGCRELAQAAIHGIRTQLQDKENGGWYAGVTCDGDILPDKQCYAHAFVILAASSASLAGIDGADALLSEALEIYDRYFWDENEGLAVDTWDTRFSTLDDYRGLNANMHSVEAFLAAADVSHDQHLTVCLRNRAGRIIDRVIAWAQDNHWRIPEHFTKSWEPDLNRNKEKPDDPFKPYGATPGHGIEWARLILQWADSLPLSEQMGPEKRHFYVSAAEHLYDCAVRDAWNCDGAPGIVYTTDWDGRPVVHDRMHWTLAEAFNTSSVLYRLTKDARYAKDYAMFMEYLDAAVLDHIYGSWFHQLDRHNQRKETVWPGKSDLYHAFQATLIPYNHNTGLSIAPSVAAANP